MQTYVSCVRTLREFPERYASIRDNAGTVLATKVPLVEEINNREDIAAAFPLCRVERYQVKEERSETHA